MREREPGQEALVKSFEGFLMKHFRVDEPEILHKAELKSLHNILGLLKQKYLEGKNLFSDEELQKMFDEFGPGISVVNNPFTQKDNFSHLLKAGVQNRRTLSIGCGIAPYEVFLASQGIIREEIVALDFTQSILDGGRMLAANAGVTNIRFKNANGTQLDYHEEFGQVWLIDSLSWIPHWRECLRRTTKTVECDGTLLISYQKDFGVATVKEVEVADIILKSGLDLTTLYHFNETDEFPRTFIAAKRVEARPDQLLVVSSF